MTTKTETQLPTDQPERFDLRSMIVADDRRQRLLQLVPEARTEGGKVDFDRLKLTLGETVDVGRERYGMNWPGKSDCFTTIQTPSMGTLRPCPDLSVEFDSTQNLIIEGDNLEVLKLLQKSYLGKVKMIYLDPPYNTGNDFIYPDNYAESLQTYLEYTGQADMEGRKFGTNSEIDGRFHSKWMNMMFPRLYLARNLLRDDGIIFISIDDTESDNLKKICNDVFGEECFVEQVVWKNKYGSGALTRGFANVHEFILCYTKLPLTSIAAPLSEETIAEYKLKDSKFATRGGYVTQPLATKSKDDRPNLRFPILWNGKEVWPEKQWIWSRERVEAAQRNDELVFSEARGKVSVRGKQYLKDENGQIRKGKPVSILNGPFNQEGTREVDELLGDDVFSFPKPSALIRYLLSFVVNEDESKDFIVLDLFAGSGSTGQAVLDLNRIDQGSRRFILVQLPQPCDEDSEAHKAGFKTIADITRERVRRVVARHKAEDAERLTTVEAATFDRGFRAFRLAESNFETWDAASPKSASSLTDQLRLHVEHIRDGRTNEDLLYEILIKSGFPLTTPVETISLAGKNVSSVADGALMICLERPLTLEAIRAIADKKPERVVCLDAGFAGNDQLKANAVQIFRTKGVGSFKTV